MVTTRAQRKEQEELGLIHNKPDEFGGPIGTLATTLALPILVLVLAHWAKVGFLDLDGLLEKANQAAIFCPSCDNPLLLAKCTAGLVAWFVLLMVL